MCVRQVATCSATAERALNTPECSSGALQRPRSRIEQPRRASLPLDAPAPVRQVTSEHCDESARVILPVRLILSSVPPASRKQATMNAALTAKPTACRRVAVVRPVRPQRCGPWSSVCHGALCHLIRARWRFLFFASSVSANVGPPLRVVVTAQMRLTRLLASAGPRLSRRTATSPSTST